MCVPIVRSIGKKCKNRMLYLTSRDSRDRYFDQEHFKINQKSLRLVTRNRHEVLKNRSSING